MCSCFKNLKKKDYFTINEKKETVLDILESLYINYDREIAYLLWDTKIRHYQERQSNMGASSIRNCLPQLV